MKAKKDATSPFTQNQQSSTEFSGFRFRLFTDFFSIRTANYPVAGRVLHCRYRSVLLGPVAFPPIRWREVKPKTHELKDDDPRVGRTETTSRPHIEIRIKRTMYRHPYIYWVVGMNRYTEWWTLEVGVGKFDEFRTARVLGETDSIPLFDSFNRVQCKLYLL